MSSKKDKSIGLDKYFMSIAMNLAKQRNGLTGLNPSVGCLIVKNNNQCKQILINKDVHFETNHPKNNK